MQDALQCRVPAIFLPQPFEYKPLRTGLNLLCTKELLQAPRDPLIPTIFYLCEYLFLPSLPLPTTQSRKSLPLAWVPLSLESLVNWCLIKTEQRAPVPPTGLGTCSLSPWHHCHHGLLPCLQHPGNSTDFPLFTSGSTTAIFPTFELQGNLIREHFPLHKPAQGRQRCKSDYLSPAPTPEQFPAAQPLPPPIGESQASKRLPLTKPQGYLKAALLTRSILGCLTSHLPGASHRH